MPSLTSSLIDNVILEAYPRLFISAFCLNVFQADTQITPTSTGSNNPPSIQDFSPSTGSNIYKTTSLEFNVIDDSSLFRDIVVMTSYSSGLYEVAHDGVSFTTQYVSSLRTQVTGGFHYVLTRSSGWPLSPSVKVIAIDRSGSENV